MRFVEMLGTATIVTGFIVIIDYFWLKSKRLGQEPWWIEYARSFFPVLLLVFLLRSFVGEPFVIPSGSMHPTLLEGDFIFVNKYCYGLRMPFTGKLLLKLKTPQRGDIIVFKHDQDETMDVIKRVIGLPGDKIDYKQQMVYVNGVPIQQVFETELYEQNAQGMPIKLRQLRELIEDRPHQILLEVPIHSEDFYSTDYRYPYQSVVVPIGHYFVMGDNRNNSKDSRIWGFLSDRDIQGRAIAIWMSWDSKAKNLWSRIRWDRLTVHLQ